MSTPNVYDWLHTIRHTASVLPNIVEGQPVPVADLHKAAAVCGWIADANPEIVYDMLERYSDMPTEALANLGRFYLAAAIHRLEEQENTK